MKVFGGELRRKERIRRRNNPEYENCPRVMITRQPYDTGDLPPLYVECGYSCRECLGNCDKHR